MSYNRDTIPPKQKFICGNIRKEIGENKYSEYTTSLSRKSITIKVIDILHDKLQMDWLNFNTIETR